LVFRAVAPWGSTWYEAWFPKDSILFYYTLEFLILSDGEPYADEGRDDEPLSFHHCVQKPTQNRILEEKEKEDKLTRFTVLYIKKRIGKSCFFSP